MAFNSCWCIISRGLFGFGLVGANLFTKVAPFVNHFCDLLKFVDWEDVLDVKILPLPDRWGKTQWLIKVRELTYWHKLISRHYSCGPEPGIVITSDLIDRERLLKIVENRLKKK